MSKRVTIRIVEGDALAFDADVLALKYAQEFFGVDGLVALRLEPTGMQTDRMRPAVGGFELIPTRSTIAADKALFVGVVDLFQFGYAEIRNFARRVLSTLATAAPDVRHVAATLHGVGYGLDEFEAFESEIAGFLDALGNGDYPGQLETISVVELDARRVERLRPLLQELYPDDQAAGRDEVRRAATTERLRAAGYASDAKSHVFVAMPFEKDMDDTYHYGIQGAVRSAGFLCERADLSTFVGDVMQWVKDRIRSSSLVIADLTDSNPNVYLEVGYAWGCDVPVVLLSRSVDHLKFDVQGQRCLVYDSIRELEESLSHEMANLVDRSRPGR